MSEYVLSPLSSMMLLDNECFLDVVNESSGFYLRK